MPEVHFYHCCQMWSVLLIGLLILSMFIENYSEEFEEALRKLLLLIWGIGSKVCVFGGDIPTTEDEYERIQDRTCCSFVCLGFMWMRCRPLVQM